MHREGGMHRGGMHRGGMHREGDACASCASPLGTPLPSELEYSSERWRRTKEHQEEYSFPVGSTSVSVFMNIVLCLKSWYLAEKPVFPPKYSRGGICTSHPKKWKKLA